MKKTWKIINGRMLYEGDKVEFTHARSRTNEDTTDIGTIEYFPNNCMFMICKGDDLFMIGDIESGGFPDREWGIINKIVKDGKK